MPILPRGKRLALVLVLLALIGGVGYFIGWYVWGTRQLRAAEQAINKRDFKRAGTILARYLNHWPSDTSARLLACQVARRSGDPELAAEHLKVFKQKKGRKESSKLEYQLLQLQQGDLQDANVFLSFCIERPDEPETPLILEALIEGSLKSLVLTAYVMREASEKLDQTPKLLQAQEAAELWLKQRQSPADQVQGLVWRGRLRAIATEYPKGLADLRKGLELDPSHFDARLYLALFLSKDAPAEAVFHFEVLRRQDPSNYQVGLFLAMTHSAVGQLNEADRILGELSVDHPNDMTVVYHRGKIALEANRLADADLYLRRVVQRVPNHAEACLALSHCLQQKGEVVEAKQYRDKFLQIEAEQKRQRHEMTSPTTSRP